MNSNKLDVQRFIDEHDVSPFQVTIVVLCFLIATLDGLDVGVIGSLAPSIAKDWHLLPGQLGQVFGAGLFGLMIGALAFGPLADRFGRKNVLLLTVFGFGASSLASGYVHDLWTLAVLRCATGFFLGGALPNALTLTSEYAPRRFRYLMVTSIPCGFTVGGALGGVVVAGLVTQADEWRRVLVLGGLLPLLLLPILAFALPESARFLVVKGKAPERLRRILQRIAPRGDFEHAAISVASEPSSQRFPLSQLFAPEYRVGTALLWITFFMGLLLYYLLISWLPIVISSSGSSLREAILLAAMFPVVSTVGAIVLGALMDRYNPYWVLMLAFACGAIAVATIGQVYGSWWALGLVIFLAGFGDGGSIIGANALSAAFYPVSMRGTGVSWALGIGRAGSIVGSMIGGVLLSMHLGLPNLFVVVAVPSMVAAISIFSMRRIAVASHASRASAPPTFASTPTARRAQDRP